MNFTAADRADASCRPESPGFCAGLEAAAQIVETRGRLVGGAIDPAITARAIRATLNNQVGTMTRDAQEVKS